MFTYAWKPALALALFAAPAAAQDAGPWRLADTLGTPDWLTVTGTQRTRYETLGGQFRAGTTGGDQLLSFRTTLFVEADLGKLRIGGEVWDARSYLGDDDSAVGTGTTNPLEPIQAYAAYSFGDALGTGSEAEVLAGRFTLDLGSRRLVGRNNFRLTTNAFTGVLGTWKGANGDAFTAFYALPQNRLPSDKASLLDNEVELDDESWNLRFWGADYTRPDLIGDLAAEFYLFGLKEDDSSAVPSRDRDLLTPGFRLFDKPAEGTYDVELEVAYQTGEARATTSPADIEDRDVRALFVHAELGRTFAGAWSPRLAFEYEYAGGDDPDTNRLTRFDGLYGVRRPDLNPTGIYGPLERGNISAPGLRLEVKPSERTDGFLHYMAVWLDEPADVFGRTGVADPAGASGRFAGHQLEARFRYWLVPDSVRLDTGAALLLGESYLDDAPNANDDTSTTYVYSDVEFTF